MRVLKFGGTSVADAAAISRVLAIVARRSGPRTIVVSALAGVTDALLETVELAGRDPLAAQAAVDSLASRHRAVAAPFRTEGNRHAIDSALDGIANGAVSTVRAIAASGRSPAIVDRLLACGELWSSRIVSAAFAAAGVPVQWLDARHVLRTNDRHGEAAPDLAATDKAVMRLVRPALALDRVVVLGGFVGSAPDGATTTLGRGGSDYSAAVLGACLMADEIEIWTDVDGVFTADPRLVPGARVLPALSYEGAETLATFGAKVLHPKTIEPAASREIPVRVLNSNRPAAPGTRIDGSGPGARGYTAVVSRDGLCLVEFTARERPVPAGFGARVLQALEDARVGIFVGELHRDRVSVAVDAAFDAGALRARVEAFAEMRSRNGLSAVCAVGDRLATDPKALAGALALFQEGPIHLVARPCGATAVAVVVEDRHAHTMVSRLHDSFVAETDEAREEMAS